MHHTYQGNLAYFFTEVPMLERVEYPSIDPVTEGVPRPFWSVMIPTYNGTKYLEKTLRSVLEQAPGADEMQIEVVDDCSTKDDPEPLVRKIGKGRISFFRQPRNLGLLANWDDCIRRARGHWIHILHQDDLILPGFYDRLRQGIEENPNVGAAFCRYIYIDDEGDWQSLSEIERRTPGILSNWIEKIATIQRVQFPSIAVKRSTYEKLGGFCPQARSAADWEMWKRIAAHYQIWYEPQLLACFRLHSSSTSSGLIRRGENITDTCRAIDISQSYLPKANARELSNAARKNYGFHALTEARQMLAQNNIDGAIAQLRAGLSCSRSLDVTKSGIYLSILIGMQWLRAKLPPGIGSRLQNEFLTAQNHL